MDSNSDPEGDQWQVVRSFHLTPIFKIYIDPYYLPDPSPIIYQILLLLSTDHSPIIYQILFLLSTRSFSYYLPDPSIIYQILILLFNLSFSYYLPDPSPIIYKICFLLFTRIFSYYLADPSPFIHQILPLSTRLFSCD